MYNQHTREMATTRHGSLVERGGRKAFVRDKGLAQKKKRKQKMSEKPDIQESRKKGFEHIELPAKLLDYFLRSNKSNINQLYIYIYTYVDSERDIQCNTLQHIGHTLQHTMLT
jgi:hypothetical protein